MTAVRTELQQKAQSTMLQYAIFRWESALVLALTLVLTFLLPRPFFWWPRFGWLILGVLGLIAIVYTSLTDEETNAQVLLAVFQEQFDPQQIQDDDLREDVETALEYQRRIETQVRRQESGVMHDRLETTANHIADWFSNIYGLALRIDAYKQDKLLTRERRDIPAEIERLTAQRKLESNPATQQQLDDVLAGKANHWQALNALDARMKQAQLQLEQSLTALATIYSQVQLVDAQSVASGRAERLQADIQEEVARLNDLVASINEVYSYGSPGLG